MSNKFRTLILGAMPGLGTLAFSGAATLKEHEGVRHVGILPALARLLRRAANPVYGDILEFFAGQK